MELLKNKDEGELINLANVYLANFTTFTKEGAHLLL